MRALVRFERSHADDDEIVGFKYGPYPGQEAYFEQLRLELEEGGFDRNMALVFGEMSTGDGDTYRFYVRMDAMPRETAVQLAQALQLAYDGGGAAGSFQVIEIIDVAVVA